MAEPYGVTRRVKNMSNNLKVGDLCVTSSIQLGVA